MIGFADFDVKELEQRYAPVPFQSDGQDLVASIHGHEVRLHWPKHMVAPDNCTIPVDIQWKVMFEWYVQSREEWEDNPQSDALEGNPLQWLTIKNPAGDVVGTGLVQAKDEESGFMSAKLLPDDEVAVAIHDACIFAGIHHILKESA